MVHVCRVHQISRINVAIHPYVVQDLVLLVMLLVDVKPLPVCLISFQ